MMKAAKNERGIWIEFAALVDVSALFALLMNNRFARRKPSGLLPKDLPVAAIAAVLEKPTPEEAAKAEPARQALEQATSQVTTQTTFFVPIRHLIIGISSWFCSQIMARVWTTSS